MMLPFWMVITKDKKQDIHNQLVCTHRLSAEPRSSLAELTGTINDTSLVARVNHWSAVSITLTITASLTKSTVLGVWFCGFSHFCLGGGAPGTNCLIILVRVQWIFARKWPAVEIRAAPNRIIIKHGQFCCILPGNNRRVHAVNNIRWQSNGHQYNVVNEWYMAVAHLMGYCHLLQLVQ